MEKETSGPAFPRARRVGTAHSCPPLPPGPPPPPPWWPAHPAPRGTKTSHKLPQTVQSTPNSLRRQQANPLCRHCDDMVGQHGHGCLHINVVPFPNVSVYVSLCLLHQAECLAGRQSLSFFLLILSSGSVGSAMGHWSCSLPLLSYFCAPISLALFPGQV